VHLSTKTEKNVALTQLNYLFCIGIREIGDAYASRFWLQRTSVFCEIIEALWFAVRVSINGILIVEFREMPGLGINQIRICAWII
jgi:hypothetical protein